MAQDAVTDVRSELLSRMDQEFAELKAVARRIAVLGPSGDDRWGPFELIGHISAWHLFAAGRLREIAAGGSGAREVDPDALNAGFVAARRGLSPKQLLTELQSSFDELRAATLAAPAAEFWLRNDPDEDDSLAHFIAAANSYEHYAEHLDALRKAARA